MRRAFVFGLIVMVLVAGGLARTQQAQAMSFRSAPVYGITCSGITQSNGSASVVWDRDTGGGNENLRYLVTDGDGTVLFEYDDVRAVGDSAGLVGFSYYETPDHNPIHFRLTSPAGNSLPEQVLVDMTGACEGLPTVEVPQAVPGCDVLMPISSAAVVGSFVAAAPTYWQPGSLTSPLITIPAGKTAWVLGQDARGKYYQIIWVCQLLWVEKSTMGPNYDAVWNGKPLPTMTVE